MQEEIEAVLERQTVIGRFLDRLNYRPIRSLYTTMNGLLELIDRFLSSDEGSLSSLRASLLSQMSNLARTFYQSSLVSQVKGGGKISDDFQDEVERAQFKGLAEREVIIDRIINIISRANELSLTKEELNSKWQETYYRLSPETETEKSLRHNLTLVSKKNTEYMKKYFADIKDEENAQAQKELVEHITDLSNQAVELGDKSQMTLHEMLDLSINPLVSIFEDELNSAEKILNQIELKAQGKKEDLSDDELGKICDILSWGLDDLTSMDELVRTGKELRNEYASLLSDFLVYLVDIDLEIQELETFILDTLKIS